MKSETLFITNDIQRNKALTRICAIIPEDQLKVVISDASGKRSQQRGLEWIWYTEVANSGMGSYDTKEGVHRAAKYRWAVPLLLRDFPDSEFALIWPDLVEMYKKDSAKIKYITDTFVSTETKGFSMSEYLTDFERYYRSHGIDLTIPDKGLLEYVESIK